MAKPNVSMPLAIITFLSLLYYTNALIPHQRYSIFDIMLMPDDPFKIIEHSPLATPREADAPPQITTTTAASIALARADWRETPTDHVITLDIPGTKKDDIKIEVEEEKCVISVTGERKMEEEVKDERWHRVERSVGKFWRQFRMPENADMKSVEGRLDDGVLKITVKKLPEGERKREARVISIVGSDDEEKIVNTKKQEL